MVHAQIVEDQENLAALGLSNQSDQKADQHLGCQHSPVLHETQLAAIGHGGDHVGGEATAADLAHTPLPPGNGGSRTLVLCELRPVSDRTRMYVNRLANGLIGVTLLAHAQGGGALFALFLRAECAGICFHRAQILTYAQI